MPGFDPNEKRDYHGRWTEGGSNVVPDYIQKKIDQNLIAALTPEEQKLLNQEYETEQQFREAYEKIIEGRKIQASESNQAGSGNRGSDGGNGEISQSEKEALHQTVTTYLDKYGKQFGAPGDVATEVLALDDQRASDISLAYHNLPLDDSSNPKVQAAYGQLAKEVDVQYDYMTKEVGIKTVFSENDPYSNSKEMMNDVIKNKSLRVYSGGDDHPLLGSKTKDSEGLTSNEKFRAVHDYFGHAIEQNQFGKLGEERAWVAHSKMFSPLAQQALTTETRGQNSWVNYSGFNTESLRKMNEGNKMIKAGKLQQGRALVEEGKKEFRFADQKVSLLPERLTDWKVYKKH